MLLAAVQAPPTQRGAAQRSASHRTALPAHKHQASAQRAEQECPPLPTYLSPILHHKLKRWRLPHTPIRPSILSIPSRRVPARRTQESSERLLNRRPPLPSTQHRASMPWNSFAWRTLLSAALLQCGCCLHGPGGSPLAPASGHQNLSAKCLGPQRIQTVCAPRPEPLAVASMGASLTRNRQCAPRGLSPSLAVASKGDLPSQAPALASGCRPG